MPKRFKSLTEVANVIKLIRAQLCPHQHNYSQIYRKYAASVVNYAKCFMSLHTCAQSYKTFFNTISTLWAWVERQLIEAAIIEAATHRTPLGGPFHRKIFM